MEKMLDDKKQTQSILEYLNLGNLCIKDLFRSGYVQGGKPRILIIEFLTVWDARLVLTKAASMKNYHLPNIFINKQLNEKEKIIEKSILKHRYELILQGVPKMSLKIRNLKLYRDGSEVKINQL